MAGPAAGLAGLVAAGAVALATREEDHPRTMIKVSDFPTLQDAVNALESGGELLIPPGSHPLASPVRFRELKNIRVVGHGATLVATKRIVALFAFTACSNVRMEGLAFDQGANRIAAYAASDYPTLYNVAVHCSGGCDGVSIDGCSFSRLYTVAIYFKDSSSLRVTGCDFASPLQPQGHHLEFILLQTFAGDCGISRNGFSGAATTRPDRSPAAVAMSGGTGRIAIENNRAQWCGRNNGDAHRLGVFDVYADCRNVTIRGNQAYDCLEQFARLSTCVDVQVIANTVTISRFASMAPAYSAITVESGSFPAVPNAVCQRIRIEGNTIVDAANRQAFMIGVLAYDWGAAPVDVRIARNLLTGSQRAFYVSGPFDSLEISGNTVRDVEQLIESTRGEGLTAALGAQSNARFARLVVDDNDATIRPGVTMVPVSVSIDSVPPFTGSVGSVHFQRNRIKAQAPATTIAVNIIVNARKTQGEFVARNNVIEGYSTPFLIRSVARATLVDNQAPGHTTLLNRGSSRYGVLEALRNR